MKIQDSEAQAARILFLEDVNEQPYRVASDPMRDGALLTVQLREAA